MPLGDLIGTIGDIRKNGLGTAFTDYVGNNTSLGRDINSAGGAFGMTLEGQQLIGSPVKQSGISHPEIKDEHLGPADDNGNRFFNDTGKKMLQDHLENQFSIAQPQPYIPQAPSNSLPQPMQGGSGGGQGKGLIGSLIGMI